MHQYAKVAEWQTRWPQKPLIFQSCGFNSHLSYLDLMSLNMFMLTSLVLFAMGAVGTFLNRRNFIIMLMCIEVMLLATNLVFLTASVALDDLTGQLLALWVMTAAAAETALGLALCVLHYRLRSTLDVELINLMKGSTLFQNIAQFGSASA